MSIRGPRGSGDFLPYWLLSAALSSAGILLALLLQAYGFAISSDPFTNGSLYLLSFALAFGVLGSRLRGLSFSSERDTASFVWSVLFAIAFGVAAAVEYAAVLLTDDVVSPAKVRTIGLGFV